MAARSDLPIHHGGYRSCQTGLFAGKPTLIIPTYSEREINARRIAALGAGDFELPTTDSSGTKKRVDASVVRTMVERILSDPSYKQNAQRMSEKLLNFAGPSYATDLIERSV
jgi:UDP:flavonoid glycosyltransferase YjiC (YdhE family)